MYNFYQNIVLYRHNFIHEQYVSNLSRKVSNVILTKKNCFKQNNLNVKPNRIPGLMSLEGALHERQHTSCLYESLDLT